MLVKTNREYVQAVMVDSPTADLDKIQAYVWAKIQDDKVWLKSFVREVVERQYPNALAAIREQHYAASAATATLRPSAPVKGTSSEKFAAAIQEPRAAPQHPITVTTPRLDPQHRHTPAPQRYEPVSLSSKPIASVIIPPRAKVHATQARVREIVPDVADINVKRARAFLAGSLLRLMMPNGKPLGECTFRECGQFGSWYKGICTVALTKHAPLDAQVSMYFDDVKLRKIQTWTHDVCAA